MGRLGGETGSDPEQQDEDTGDRRHLGYKDTYPGKGGGGWSTGSPGTGARSSVSTATCGSNCRIIRTNAPASSGSNSVPARSSMYDKVFDCGHASRYGRLVRSASSPS